MAEHGIAWHLQMFHNEDVGEKLTTLKGFEIAMDEDGHCLYHGVAHELRRLQHGSMAACDIRIALATWISNNATHVFNGQEMWQHILGETGALRTCACACACVGALHVLCVCVCMSSVRVYVKFTCACACAYAHAHAHAHAPCPTSCTYPSIKIHAPRVVPIPMSQVNLFGRTLHDRHSLAMEGS